MTNVNVVEEDVVLHGPDLETNGSHRLEVGWVLVLKVVWVLDLARSPDTLVGWVVYVWCGPLALVRLVLDKRLLPWSTARDFVTLGVADSRRAARV